MTSPSRNPGDGEAECGRDRCGCARCDSGHCRQPYRPRPPDGGPDIRLAPGQPHEFTLFQLSPGKKAEDVTKYIETGMKGAPPARPIGGVAGMAAGHDVYYDVDLTPGDYAIICFLEDAKDGKPHFTHGMIQQIHVS